jgi:hypothetical protein
MSSASHEGSSVNSFLPMPIRGELSFLQGIRDGKASKERHHSVETALVRHAEDRRTFPRITGLCNAVAVLPGSGDG